MMKASRSEAARAAGRADESNLPHARLQGQAPGGRRERPSCGSINQGNVLAIPPFSHIYVAI
ncbi:MAG: hypothetical protein MUP73_06785 [Dehalococcoidia bacterium]|nr:hypothetical protein [Dehalococcoidia bacterium]